jgi:hypothetical protein
MSLNFRDGKWGELSLTLTWPHHAFILGWSLFEPTKDQPSYMFRLHLGLVTINYEWGDEDWEFNE